MSEGRRLLENGIYANFFYGGGQAEEAMRIFGSLYGRRTDKVASGSRPGVFTCYGVNVEAKEDWSL